MHDAAWYSAYDAPAKRYLQGQPSPQPMVWKPSPLEPALGYPHRKALFQYCLIHYYSILFRLFLCFRTSLIFLEPTVNSSCNLMGVCLWVLLTQKVTTENQLRQEFSHDGSCSSLRTHFHKVSASAMLTMNALQRLPRERRVTSGVMSSSCFPDFLMIAHWQGSKSSRKQPLIYDYSAMPSCSDTKASQYRFISMCIYTKQLSDVVVWISILDGWQENAFQ